MTCPNCSRTIADGSRFCPFCGQRIDPASVEREHVRAALAPESVTISPGASASLTVSVANVGTVVEHVRLQVEAPVDAWATVRPQQLRVMPGARTPAAIELHPPKSRDVPAGRHSVVLAVRRDDALGAVLARASAFADVRPVHEAEMRILPRRAAARRTSTRALELINTGNAPLTLRLQATDPDEALEFGMPPNGVGLALSSSLSRRFDARARRPRLWGRSVEREFSVQADWEDGGKTTATGTFVQKSWRLVIVIALLAVFVLLAILHAKKVI